MQHAGHGKEPGGATEKGTRVDKLEEEVAKVHCLENRVKELQSGIKDLHTLRSPRSRLNWNER